MKHLIRILLAGTILFHGLAHSALIRGEFTASLYTDAQSQGTGSYQTDYSGASVTGFFVVDSTNRVRSSPFTLGITDYLVTLTPLASTSAPEITFAYDVDEVNIDRYNGDSFNLAFPGSTLNLSVTEYLGSPSGPFGTTPAISLSFPLPTELFYNKDLADMVGSTGLTLTDDGPNHALVYNIGGAYGGTYISSTSLTLSPFTASTSQEVSEPSTLALMGCLLISCAVRLRGKYLP